MQQSRLQHQRQFLRRLPLRGVDDFLVEVSYRQRNQPGKFYVHFAVTVQ
jgi:hypothetical protein